MAIGPNSLDASTKNTADQIEKHLDQQIPNSSDRGGYIIVYPPHDRQITQDVKDEISRRYGRDGAGWNRVDWKDDTTEGGYWIELYK